MCARASGHVIPDAQVRLSGRSRPWLLSWFLLWPWWVGWCWIIRWEGLEEDVCRLSPGRDALGGEVGVFGEAAGWDQRLCGVQGERGERGGKEGWNGR